MNNLYTNLKMIGYKINEMSNGDFIGKRPNGKQSLFNSKCELMLEGFTTIQQVSKEVYVGVRKAKLIMFTREGKILDTVDADYEWMNYFKTGRIRGNYISFRLSGDEDDDDCIENVYSLDGKTQFKGIETWRVVDIITQDGDTKLVCYNSENGTPVMEFIDEEGNIDTIEMGFIGFRSVNNNFILNYTDDTYNLMDLDGNLILNGQRLIIDDINLDNDNVLIAEGSTIGIRSMGEGFYTEYKANSEIKELDFTTNKDILWLTEVDDERGYLINIKTKQRTPSEFNVATLIGNIVLVKLEEHRTSVCKLNPDTFELTEVFTCDYCNCNTENIIVYKDGREQYYNLDLEPLLHEI